MKRIYGIIAALILSVAGISGAVYFGTQNYEVYLVLENEGVAVTDDSISRNLLQDTPENLTVDAQAYGMSELVYLKNGRLFLGEDKLAMSSAYPLFMNDGSTLYCLSDGIKAITEELLYKIPFGIAYKTLTESSSTMDAEYAFRILSRYKPENLPDKFRQLLRKRKYKASEDTMKELKLYKTENIDMHKLIRSFTVKNDMTADRIRLELSKNKIHSKRILFYALQNVNTKNSRLEEILYDTDKIDENAWVQLRKLYDNNGPAIRSIVKNLRKMDLLPEEHIVLADGLINKTARYSDLHTGK